MRINKFSVAFLLTLTLLFTVSSTLSAQEEPSSSYTRHEIHAGYGFYTLLDFSVSMLQALGFAFVTPITGTFTTSDNGSWGPLYAGYTFYPLKWFGVGFTFAWEENRLRYTFANGTYTDSNWQFASFLVRVNFQYGWEWVKFYHSIYAGTTYAYNTYASTGGISTVEGKFLPAAHLTAFGVRVGKTFSVFAEVGFGFLGLVNVGISVQF